jgi:hypothetical protein
MRSPRVNFKFAPRPLARLGGDVRSHPHSFGVASWAMEQAGGMLDETRGGSFAELNSSPTSSMTFLSPAAAMRAAERMLRRYSATSGAWRRRRQAVLTALRRPAARSTQQRRRPSRAVRAASVPRGDPHEPDPALAGARGDIGVLCA